MASFGTAIRRVSNRGMPAVSLRRRFMLGEMCRLAPTCVRAVAACPLRHIFGYPDPAPVRQPIGHISTQTGPNRWEYHPIYAEDVASCASHPTPLAGATTPLAGPPAEQAPGRRIPPPPEPARDIPAPRGPRVF